MCAGLKIVLKKLWIIKSVYIVEVHIKHISLTLPVLEGTGLCFYSIGFDCHGVVCTPKDSYLQSCKETK